MASLTAAAHRLIGIALAVTAGVLQAVIASSPTNDDFLHVVLARQILAGDWPVRDFFDLGTWLSYGISAASQLVFGHRLLAENDIPPHVDRVLSKPPRLSDLRNALLQLSETGVGAKSGARQAGLPA